jgi:hypothetical protein
MKSLIIILISLFLCACNNQNESLELENIKLKYKLFRDSILEINKRKVENFNLSTKEQNLQNEIQNKTQNKINSINSKREERLKWLCNYANNKESPVRFFMDIPESRFIKIERNGDFKVKTYEGYNNKLTSIISGNLKDLNPKSVRIVYSKEDYLFIQINCISSNCVCENGKNIHGIVSFGPYRSDYIIDFPNKLKVAFEEVIYDINSYEEYY